MVFDFMPRPAIGGTHELVRIVRGIEGRVGIAMDLRLRFNYGAWTPWVERKEGMIIGTAGPDAVRLSSTVDLTNIDFSTRARFDVTSGQSVATMLEWFPSHETPPIPRDPYALMRRTEADWARWAKSCTFAGPHADVVRRSLITLKALTYRPTGGIVAAPTTSLPEMPGGVRNWDYRYCWLRDAVLTIYALTGSGFHEEASAWRWWLMRAAAGAPDELQIMYGLHGERRLTEIELDHLPGYEDSRPVRVGNAAHGQLQLDVYGSVLGAFDAGRRAGLPDMDAVWPLQRAIAKNLLTLWKQPDSGLWEVRGPARHFVYSKVMCWLAFDRMVASAEDFGLDGPVEEWRDARDAIHADICDKGYDAASNSFVQYYGATWWTRRCCSSRCWAFCRPTIRACWARSRGSSASCCRTASSIAIARMRPMPMGCRDTKAPSSPAASGCATLGCCPAAPTTRGHCSSACSRTATTWVCSPRNMIQSPVASWAISRRRSVILRWSTQRTHWPAKPAVSPSIWPTDRQWTHRFKACRSAGREASASRSTPSGIRTFRQGAPCQWLRSRPFLIRHGPACPGHRRTKCLQSWSRQAEP